MFRVEPTKQKCKTKLQTEDCRIVRETITAFTQKYETFGILMDKNKAHQITDCSIIQVKKTTEAKTITFYNIIIAPVRNYCHYFYFSLRLMDFTNGQACFGNHDLSL